MATLGTLAVNIVAKTQPLVAGVTKAQATIGQFAAGVGKAAARLKLFALAAGSAAAAVGTAMVKSQMDAIDVLAKTSDKAGIATEKLVGLQHAGELAGVSAGNLEKALILMNRNLAEAADGSTAQVEAFQRIGISVNDLMAMSPDQRMYAIADALAGMDSSARKTQAAMDIFGRSGATLLPMLQGGSEGLRAMQADAEALGLTLSRDAAAQVEAANDALSRLSMAVSGMFRAVAVEVSPVITDLANKMTEWLTSSSLLAGSAGESLGGISSALGMMADVIHTVKLAWTGLQAVVTSVLAFVVDKINAAIQFVIKQVNRLPGVNISADFADGFASSLNKQAEDARAKFSEDLKAKTPSEIMAQAKAAQPNPVATRASAEGFAKALGDNKVVAALKNSFSQAKGVGGGLLAGLGNAGKALDAGVMAGLKFSQTEGPRIAAEQARKQREKDAMFDGSRELTARTAGSLDTYAAARRNLRAGTEKAAIKTERNTAATVAQLKKIANKLTGGGLAALPVGG